MPAQFENPHLDKDISFFAVDEMDSIDIMLRR